MFIINLHPTKTNDSESATSEGSVERMCICPLQGDVLTSEAERDSDDEIIRTMLGLQQEIDGNLNIST